MTISKLLMFAMSTFFIVFVLVLLLLTRYSQASAQVALPEPMEYQDGSLGVAIIDLSDIKTSEGITEEESVSLPPKFYIPLTRGFTLYVGEGMLDQQHDTGGDTPVENRTVERPCQCGETCCE